MVRVLLVDDHQMLREGLRSLIDGEQDIEVIGEASDGRTAVGQARESAPDVVVMDVGMPGLNGIDATRRIRSELPKVKVIALSVHEDREFVAKMLRAGASGYVLKDGAFRELAEAIRLVVEGKSYLSPGITRTVIEDLLRQPKEMEDGSITLLTPREREVLQLLAEGKSTKETASILNVTEKTVETHRQSIREKLGLRTIADLTRFAVRVGLVSLDG